MQQLIFSVLKIVAYAVVVMAGFSLAYFTIGDPVEATVSGFGATADTANLAKTIVSMVVGFGLGEVTKRWLQRRLSDEA